MVLRILNHRFGSDALVIEERIRRLPLATLRRLVDVSLDARTLNDVLGVIDAMQS